MRAFRKEAQLSWPDFNHLWMDLCNFLNSPAYDVLLDVAKVREDEYSRKLQAITSDILSSGVFGSHRPGTWTYGRYEDEPDLLR